MVSPILWCRTRRDARRIDPGELAAAVQLRERCRTRCPASTLAPIFPPDRTLEASAAKRRCGSAAQFTDRRMRATRPSPAALSPEASRPSRNRVVMTAPTRSAFASTIILPRQVPPAGILPLRSRSTQPISCRFTRTIQRRSAGSNTGDVLVPAKPPLDGAARSPTHRKIIESS